MARASKFSWGLLVKILIVLVFLSPFLCVPLRELKNRLGHKAVYLSGSLFPFGGFAHPERFFFVSLGPCANADYHHDPFTPHPDAGEGRFPGLRAGLYLAKGAPLLIAEPYAKTRAASVITTGENPYFSCRLPLTQRSSTALHLALARVWTENPSSRIARLQVLYSQGASTDKILRSREKGVLLGENKEGLTIQVLSLSLNSQSIPVALEVTTMPAVGTQKKQPAIAIFAVTQEFKS